MMSRSAALGALVAVVCPAIALAGTTRNEGGGNLTRYYQEFGEIGCFTSLYLQDEWGAGWHDGGDGVQNAGVTDWWEYGGVSLVPGSEYATVGGLNIDVNGGWNLFHWMGVYVDSANCNQSTFDLQMTFDGASHPGMEVFIAPSGTSVTDFTTALHTGTPGAVIVLANDVAFDPTGGSQAGEAYPITMGVHLPANMTSPASFSTSSHFELLPNF